MCVGSRALGYAEFLGVWISLFMNACEHMVFVEIRLPDSSRIRIVEIQFGVVVPLFLDYV